jgi:RimJ/RimL family protein N-acetyltransferase
MRVQFETARLYIKRLIPSDLDALLEVWLSNPQYLQLTEGSRGQSGHYDLGMLQRDFAIAQVTPGRVFGGIWRKDNAELIGALDWLIQNPNDDHPWLGLIIIQADQQRQRFAHEVVADLVSHLAAKRRYSARAAIIDGNEAGAATMRALGFVPIATRSLKTATGDSRTTIFELPRDTDG